MCCVQWPSVVMLTLFLKGRRTIFAYTNPHVKLRGYDFLEFPFFRVINWQYFICWDDTHSGYAGQSTCGAFILFQTLIQLSNKIRWQTMTVATLNELEQLSVKMLFCLLWTLWTTPLEQRHMEMTRVQIEPGSSLLQIFIGRVAFHDVYTDGSLLNVTLELVLEQTF